MTFPETTTPSTDTETASQSCDDDPFGLDQIPTFLRRTPNDPLPVAEAMRSTPDQRR